MTRAPVFWFSCVEDAASFYDLLPHLFSEFRDAAESTSKYACLEKITPRLVGNTVHTIFEYHCGEAAGQNMVTFATQQACDLFTASTTAQEMRLQKISIEGSLATEKSLSWGNILNSRGVSVMAWGRITKEACESTLGCSTWDLYQSTMNSKEAAIRHGQLGYMWQNLPGYDRGTEELCVSTYFPSLPVGTVGGGTTYDTQREALEILGCTGSGSKRRLAGLIASFALALDVSTAAASHYKFGRSAADAQPKL
ncbi:unnamed protein product [Penicillium egyptiacum]|uniref:hydroxymethylglutaryl-CoA reductase (NADPH) n=1 Tax=Penicillium egyptiacum TaxID=1303716 RepID=A0A9W4KDR9_9EURO|nr:unnamed protein product [Penicillium egyptiacum]